MPDIWWIFPRPDWVSIIDILLVALIFYWLMFLVQGTQAVQLLRGVLILVVLAILLTTFFRLTAFSWLIKNSIPALLVSIPVIFQPELRRALERLGRTGLLLNRPGQEEVIDQVIDSIARAAHLLSKRRYGALIVLERETGLQEYVDTGVMINGLVSTELLLTIFQPNTALHDGAVIIRDDKVVAAACVLPLSVNMPGQRHLGTRHRAAVGVTEQSDAVTVVVSEETGIISIAHNGRMIRRLDEKRLRKVLRAFYRPQFGEGLPRWLRNTGSREGSRLSHFYSTLRNSKGSRR